MKDINLPYISITIFQYNLINSNFVIYFAKLVRIRFHDRNFNPFSEDHNKKYKIQVRVP